MQDPVGMEDQAVTVPEATAQEDIVQQVTVPAGTASATDQLADTFRVEVCPQLRQSIR